jgi:signal transduction histidine kinase
MLVLVALSSVAAAAAPPLAYHLVKRRELLAAGRADAERVARAVQEIATERPLLWRYDAAKISERLMGEGLASSRVVVRDAAGAAVPLGNLDVTSPRLWVARPIVVGDREIARAWVVVDARPLWTGTAVLAAVTGLVGAILGLFLYLVPVRAIGAAEARIAALMGRLAHTLQEEERGRIARDLHDGAGQAITAARLELLAFSRASDDAGKARAQRIAGLLDAALDEVRRSTSVLMPPALAELGLVGAVERHCQAFAGAAGIEVTCEADPAWPALDAHVETALYRIVQEALSNTARHAGAKRVWVRLTRDADGEGVELVIRDDGRGMSGDETPGRGLASILERARLLGGEARLAGADGLSVAVRVPVRAPS